MPLSDWIRLAVRGVMRRKLRSLSNAVGVIAGTALLAITIAGGQGIMATLQRELLANPWLRRVQVMPLYEDADAEPPADAIPDFDLADPELEGRLVKRYQKNWVSQQDLLPPKGISLSEVKAFRELSGVEFVLPELHVTLELQVGEADPVLVRRPGDSVCRSGSAEPNRVAR